MQHIINDWFFADLDPDSPYGIRVALSQTDGAAVCGNLDNQLVAVASIAKFGPNYIITNGDTRYELGDIHPDYNEMILANSEEIPILDYWDITEADDLFDDSSGLCLDMEWDEFIDYYNERSHHRGYVLSGICNSITIEGEIIAQRGNFITLKYHNPYYGISSSLNVFVVWPNIGVVTAKKLISGQLDEEVSVMELENSFSMPCRPLFKLNN